MLSAEEAVELTRRELERFCLEFLAHPYLCYTEHGLHYRFAARLYHALPAADRYHEPGGIRMCRVQKEYPTNTHLGRSKRQHWDVSLASRATELPSRTHPLDHLHLTTVIEFGLNDSVEHLEDDIDRLSHNEANLQQGFAVHLFRLSAILNRPSGRDSSPRSGRLLTAEDVLRRLSGKSVEVYLGVHDSTKSTPSGLWRITAAGLETIAPIGTSPKAATFPDVRDRAAPPSSGDE